MLLSRGRCRTLIAFACFVAVTFLLQPCLPAFAQQVPLAQHVILVVEENTSFDTVVGPPPSMPWLVGEGGLYGYAANYYSNASGSLLDYLWLASGSSEGAFGCNGNGCSSAITDQNIFRLMNSQPISWKVYAQSYLNAGGMVTAPDNGRGTHYYRRHNAAVWYSDILSNVLGSQGAVVDFEQFLVDVANGTLPRYSIIVPDGAHDAHDGSPTVADTFLANNLPTILTQPDFQSGGSGLLIVTFDNGDGDSQGQIYTAFIGPNVKPGAVSDVYYQHQNTVRTMLDSLGINTYPAGAAGAADMSDFFAANAGSVIINSPANQSIQGTSVSVNAVALELASAIDHMEIWDNGTKLTGAAGSIVNQTFTLRPGSHRMTVRDIGPGPDHPLLHMQVTNFVVSSNQGVFVNVPADGSTQAALFPLRAYAVESTGNIDHLEVWADGKKLGDSPKGSTVSQWFGSLATGSHQVTVEDVDSSGAALHKSVINITVSASNNMYVNSPADSSLQGSSVLVSAYAYEQNNSTQQVDHLEVWDNGTKLGNSPLGWGVTSLFIDQRYTLKSGSHQMTIEDIGPGPNFAVVHKSAVNFTVQ